MHVTYIYIVISIHVQVHTFKLFHYCSEFVSSQCCQAAVSPQTFSLLLPESPPRDVLAPQHERPIGPRVSKYILDTSNKKNMSQNQGEKKRIAWMTIKSISKVGKLVAFKTSDFLRHLLTWFFGRLGGLINIFHVGSHILPP